MDFELIKGDCLDVMRNIPDKSVDMVLTDPPYGTTACKWDTVIPFEPMWEELDRIVKGNGAVVLFGREPFSSRLRISNIGKFKYDWIWKKNRAVGFVNAKLKPLNIYEVISVFSDGKTANLNKNNMPYFPQGLLACGKKQTLRKKHEGENDYWRPSHSEYVQQYTNYPTSVLEFPKDDILRVHPTQKPVALLEYLIRTYSREGETVLDFTMGSGSTGVACVNTDRNFIGIELEDKYFEIAKDRIGKAKAEKEGVVDFEGKMEKK